MRRYYQNSLVKKSKIAKKYRIKLMKKEKNHQIIMKKRIIRKRICSIRYRDPAAVKKRLIDQNKRYKEKQLIKNLTEEAGNMELMHLLKIKRESVRWRIFILAIDNVLYSGTVPIKVIIEELKDL